MAACRRDPQDRDTSAGMGVGMVGCAHVVNWSSKKLRMMPGSTSIDGRLVENFDGED
jgi:hypothetical protein